MLKGHRESKMIQKFSIKSCYVAARRTGENGVFQLRLTAFISQGHTLNKSERTLWQSKQNTEQLQLFGSFQVVVKKI